MQLTESDKETLLVAKDLLLSGRIAEALLDHGPPDVPR